MSLQALMALLGHVTPEFGPALDDQLADIKVLREDAAARGWDSEVARHDRVITSIEAHTRRLNSRRPPAPSLDSSPEGRL